jgi:catechol-2,3-dioxygenase
MAGFAIKRVGHVGVWVDNLEAMTDYYQRVLGFLVSDRIEDDKDQVAYLTRNATEHHQMVFAVSNRGVQESASLHNISFSIDSLTELKDAFELLGEDQSTAEVTAVDHGNSWSVHFKDIEGNNCEIFCLTPWRVAKPYDEPLDLSVSVEEIIEKSKELAFAREGTNPSDVWQTKTRRRLKTT